MRIVASLPLNQSTIKTWFWSLLMSGCCAFFVYFPLTDTDIWWHLAAGREMLAHKAFLFKDPFAYSTSQATWIDLHWLFQIMAYGLYRVGGAGLLVFVKCFLVAASIMILSRALIKSHVGAFTAITACIIVYQCRYHIDFRPIVLSLLFLAIMVMFLERVRSYKGYGNIFVVWGAQLLWTNSQGLFALGWCIAAAYALGELWDYWAAVKSGGSVPAQRTAGIKRVWVAMVGVVAISVVNPYGFEALLFPLTLAQRINPVTANIFSGNISENVPLLSLWGSAPWLVITVLFTGILVLGLLILDKKGWQASHCLLLVGFFCLAMMAQRNIVLFLFVAFPLIGYHLPGALAAPVVSGNGGRRAREVARGVMVSSGVLIVVFCVFRHATIVGRYPYQEAVSPFCVPESSVEYLRNHPVPGKIFNSIRNGGYLIWNFFPSKQVFIDSRLVIRESSFFADYLHLLDNPELFDMVASRYAITHVLLPTALFYRDMHLVHYLYRNPRWSMVHTDGASALFVRDSLATTPAIILEDRLSVEKITAQVSQRWERTPAIKREALRHIHQFVMNLGIAHNASLSSDRSDLHDARGRGKVMSPLMP